MFGANERNIACAIWLRQVLPVHTKSTTGAEDADDVCNTRDAGDTDVGSMKGAVDSDCSSNLR